MDFKMKCLRVVGALNGNLNPIICSHNLTAKLYDRA